MDDASSILAAVLADPLNDTPRLAYADYLDDHRGTIECKRCGAATSIGRPASHCPFCFGTKVVSNEAAERAEFIRVQIELAKHVRPDTSCVCRAVEDKFHCASCLWWDETEPLRRRERELWHLFGCGKANCGGLLVGLPGESPSFDIRDGECNITAGYGPPINYRVRRGFVDEVILPLDLFFDQRCQSCAGTGRLNTGEYDAFDDHYVTVPCGCDRGREAGIASWLFANLPLTIVIPADRTPFFSRELGNTWGWHQDTSLPAGLPEPVLRHCSGPHATAGDAYNAASESMVRYGRGLHELPELAFYPRRYPTPVPA